MLLQGLKVFLQLLSVLRLRFSHSLLHLDGLANHQGGFFLQLLLLAESSKDEVRLRLASLHVQTHAKRDNKNRAEEDSNNGGNDDDGPSWKSLRVVISIANRRHSDENAPKAVAVIFKACLQP